MPRRAALPLVAVAALGLGATGCEKPTPYVGIVIDGTFTRTQAAQYCFDEPCQPIDPQQCQGSTVGTKLTVPERVTIGIDVPRQLAEHGWTFNGDRQGKVRHEHYHRIGPVDLNPERPARLTVLQTPDGQRIFGCWNFDLVVE